MDRSAENQLYAHEAIEVVCCTDRVKPHREWAIRLSSVISRLPRTGGETADSKKNIGDRG